MCFDLRPVAASMCGGSMRSTLEDQESAARSHRLARQIVIERPASKTPVEQRRAKALGAAGLDGSRFLERGSAKAICTAGIDVS